MVKHIIVASLLVSMSICAQVGINVKNPVGIFQIDAKGNTESSLDYSDDIVVDKMGNMVLGASTPYAGTKFDVNGKIRFNNGEPIDDNSLLISDANGNARWQKFVNEVRLFDLSLTNLTVQLTPSNQNVWFKTPASISVPPGKYIVSASLKSRAAGLPVSNTGFIDLTYTLNDNANSLVYPSSNFEFVPNTIQGSFINVLISGTCPYGINAGYYIINNKTSTDLTLYLYVKINSTNVINDGSVVLNGLGYAYGDVYFVVYSVNA